MSPRRGRGCPGIALLAVAGALVGCGDRAASTGERAAPVPAVTVRVGRITERIFYPAVFAPGQWISSNELVVSAPFSAIVDSLGPHLGDHVSRHDVIAWLMTRESQAAVRGAELLLRQATDSTGREEAQRSLGLAQRDIVRVPLAAPTTGTIVRRAVEPGAVVAEGTEILAIIPDGVLVFEAHVPLAGASAVSVGRRARVSSEGGAALDATVQRFLPSASAPDQSAVVWLSPAGEVPAGLLGRFGRAFIETGAPRRAAAVPDAALVEDDLTGDVQVARVDSTGIAIWTKVKLGLDDGGWRELLAPAMRPGTAVVISGQRGLPDSSRVIPLP